MQLSHYFLSNAGLVSGVSTEIDSSNFSQILAFDSDRKTSCLLQKCKILYKFYKNIVLSFFKQKLNKYWNNIWKVMQHNFGPKKTEGFFS